MTVGVCHDKQAGGGEWIVIGKICAFAARCEKAWRIACAAQRDAIRIGERSHLSGRIACGYIGRCAGEALGFGADLGKRGVIDLMGHSTGVFQRFEAQSEIGGCALKNITFAQKCCDRRGRFTCEGKHVAKARVYGQGRERAAMSSNAMLCIKGTKSQQEALRLCECAFGGSCEQGQISAAPKGEFKGERGKISHLNFSRRKGGQR